MKVPASVRRISSTIAVILVVGFSYLTSCSSNTATHHEGRRGDEVDRHDQAIAQHSDVIRRNPDDADSYLARANAYFKKDQYGSAIDDYSKVIGSTAECLDAYVGRALSYIMNGQFTEGICDANEVIRINSPDPGGYLLRFQGHLGNRDYAMASLDWLTIRPHLELDEQDMDERQRKTFELGHDGDVEKALETIVESVGSELGRVALLYMKGMYKRFGEYCILAYVYGNQGVRRGEETLGLQAVADDEFGDASSRGERSFIHYIKRDFDLARTDLEAEIREDGESADPYVGLGMIDLTTGEYEKAIGALDEAIQIDPNLGRAFWLRSQVYELRGDDERAERDRLLAIENDDILKELEELPEPYNLGSLFEAAAKLVSQE